ncbi:MAG: hypothetical protein AUJ86_00535 [Hydrogenophilaceae bacterium CG1_02_62_390]|nr:hypothetical protein [Betaproteobacteria bacterium]OIO79952.1 MAG: hypothetical protein AUJ86_00535 [Hydrogenophilaceae bacterium CG1_02_62_390]PIW38650.1 MAG: hypothetical protein COW23_05305 [Hydrogenophilales bacterium CG15_BIG_FIL_POST_REV_8_21_14_020_62_31]PIX00883.1 MAG: hypothetical protein COZ79_09765 [Hydrogenophilales bacterium CG_4_8_14_3_um_filter_62_83]PIY97600.1 MAG: hypothetical protein COY64_10535 [Hydrogenophilales bacterium CG_4_10_14_0_8_um_filter_62_70]
MNRYLLLLLLFPALTALALDIDLAAKVAPGKWALAYQRTGEFKPLHIKHHEAGTSYTCIGGDPRAKIVAWIQSKDCVVHSERMDEKVYRMDGECRLKWWQGESIPVSVELRPETSKTFTLDIHTNGNSLLGFTEHTQAALQGPCDTLESQLKPLPRQPVL